MTDINRVSPSRPGLRDEIRILPPSGPVTVIGSDDEAIAAAHAVADDIGRDAALRDRERRLPVDELDRYSRSGLWGIRVPKSHGGAEVSYATVARVFAIVSAADPSIGQIGQSHNSAVHFIRTLGTERQRDFFLGHILNGYRLGNASAEFGRTFETRLLRQGDGYVLSGRKFYATGALLAHFVAVAALDADGRRQVAILDRATPGLTIVDDWESFGQRTTASGTVILDDVKVPDWRVIPIHRSYEESPQGAISQLSHVGIDVGIATAAIRDTVEFVRTRSRPARDTDVAEAWLDPFTIHAVGDLHIQLHAAEALMERAGRIIDRTLLAPGDEAVAEASIAVAEAKAVATEVALSATNRLFELAGTRSTLTPNAFDRHWRNARTHTIHDAARWKYHAVGNYYLNGVKPPRVGSL
jgi:SfnB family sulfur acquisition oxidoreductase